MEVAALGEIPWDLSSVAVHIPIMCRTIDWPGPRVLEFTSCRWRAARVVEWLRLCEGWWPLSCNWSRDRPLMTDIVIATRLIRTSLRQILLDVIRGTRSRSGYWRKGGWSLMKFITPWGALKRW
jgi:hypothetical protein